MRDTFTNPLIGVMFAAVTLYAAGTSAGSAAVATPAQQVATTKPPANAAKKPAKTHKAKKVPGGSAYASAAAPAASK